MHIATVTTSNLRGLSIHKALGPVTVILGDNFTGKTTIPDAVRLALCGYLPGVKRTPGDLWAALSPDAAKAGEIGVQLHMDNGRRIEAGLTRTSKGSVSTVGAPPADLALPMPLVDVRQFFDMTAAQRTDAIFRAAGDVTIQPDDIATELWKIDAKPTRVRDEVVRGLIATVNKAFEGKPRAQDALVEVLPKMGDDLKAAKTKAKIAQGAFAGMKLPAEPPTAPEGLEAKQAEYERLLGLKGELTGLLREETDGASMSVEIPKLKARVAELRAKADALPDPGNRPEPPAILAEHERAEEKAEQLRGEIEMLEAELHRLTEEANALAGVTICPTCGANGSLAAVEKRLRVRGGEIASAIEAAKAKVIELLEPFSGCAVKAAEHDERVAAWKAECDAKEDAEQEATQHESELKALQSRAEALSGDRKARIAELNEELKPLAALAEQITALSARKTAWDDYQRLLTDRDKREKESLEADCTVEVLNAAIKMIDKKVNEASTKAFGEVLKLSDVFTEGLLNSTLQFNGDLGRRTALGGWVPHTSFSGTEQLLAYAGFGVALARKAPFRLVVLDELGRLTPQRRKQVTQRMIALVSQGLIDQCIMIDATPVGSAFDAGGVDLVDSTYCFPGVTRVLMD